MEKRTNKDRRSGSIEMEKSFPCNRRRMPDRRLNNISVEWIPSEKAGNNTLIRLMFWKP
jgi:hypothetical protein